MDYRPRKSIEELKKFILDNVRKEGNGCWIWTMKTRHGYGRIRYQNVQQSLHRVAYQIWHNESIAVGLCVCHKCDVKNCCNPEHLFVGTLTDNNRDRARKWRSAFGERNQNCAVSDIETLQIQDMIRSGLFSCTTIAKMYGVGTYSIRSIKNGQRIALSPVHAVGFDNIICRRCSRPTNSVKGKPVNGMCHSCYTHSIRAGLKKKRGIKTRKFTYRKKLNLRDV